MSYQAPTRNFLDEIAVFQGLSVQSRCILHVAADERIYHRGEVIVREGDFGDRIYVLATGSVQVVKGCGTPHELILANIPKNSVFGEMCVVEGLLRSASVRAAEACLVYSVTNAALNKFGGFWPDEYTKFLINLARELSRRLREQDQMFAAQSF